VTLFADQAAIAVENARLYNQAQEEIRQRRQVELLLQHSNEMLEQRVNERTVQLVEANQQLALGERERAEAQIRSSLLEKEVLLKEIHHRVKNNLQVISSLLNLQFGKIDEQETQTALIESQNRVRSMALIHEKIYQSKNLAEVDFSEYIDSLASYLFRSYRTTNGAIQLNLMIDKISLGIDNAVPCGLILNELISNTLKYAFPGGKNGEITIKLNMPDPHTVALMVQDNGVGLPGTFDFYNPSSLGMKLVNMLVSQLDGTIQVESTVGAKFMIHFPMNGAKNN
jgi:two-component sensor histidine kinase